MNNNTSLPPTDYIFNQQWNLDLLALLVVDFTWGLVHHYQDPHAPWTLIMNHILYFYIPMYPLRHARLFPCHILFFSFMVLSSLKFCPDQTEFFQIPRNDLI